MNRFPRVPPRLFLLHVSQPLYFITICTQDRVPILANNRLHDAFLAFCDASLAKQGVAIGRYVIMPDHLHFFVRLPDSIRLGQWIGRLKQCLTLTLLRAMERKGAVVWQRGFFDHILRSDESYSQKWQYVALNPVRKGLVTSVNDWPFGGEIVPIDRA